MSWDYLLYVSVSGLGLIRSVYLLSWCHFIFTLYFIRITIVISSYRISETALMSKWVSWQQILSSCEELYPVNRHSTYVTSSSKHCIPDYRSYNMSSRSLTMYVNKIHKFSNANYAVQFRVTYIQISYHRQSHKRHKYYLRYVEWRNECINVLCFYLLIIKILCTYYYTSFQSFEHKQLWNLNKNVFEAEERRWKRTEYCTNCNNLCIYTFCLVASMSPCQRLLAHIRNEWRGDEEKRWQATEQAEGENSKKTSSRLGRRDVETSTSHSILLQLQPSKNNII